MADGVVIALTLAVMLVGVVGVVVPVLPGVVVVGTAAIVATFVLGIDAAGWALVVAITALTLAGATASIVLPARRGRRGDAARSSLAIAAAGGLVGFFVVPVLGLPIGAVLGLFAAELRRTGDRDRAWNTTRSVVTAYGLGVLVELVVAIAIIATWLTATLLRL